jgi:Fe-S-cluster-containing hydrogenase component 2
MITCPTIRYDIFIAGDIEQAKQACREYCFGCGLCVTIEPVTYIYTGGEEAGVRVGLINYARFPSTKEELKARANGLADLLMKWLCQNSYSIVGPDETDWFSRRSDTPQLQSGAWK